MHIRERDVAPLAGAWIEIVYSVESPDKCIVAPLAGAWIEIYEGMDGVYVLNGRSPCGSVD